MNKLTDIAKKASKLKAAMSFNFSISVVFISSFLWSVYALWKNDFHYGNSRPAMMLFAITAIVILLLRVTPSNSLWVGIVLIGVIIAGDQLIFYIIDKRYGENSGTLASSGQHDNKYSLPYGEKSGSIARKSEIK